MRLTRREVHKGFAGLALAALGGRVAQASPGASLDDVFLNRLTFGATPEARIELASLGREAWLEAQLAMPANAPEIQARLAAMRLWIEYEAGQAEPLEEGGDRAAWPATAEFRPLDWLNAPADELVSLLDWYAPISFAERVRPAAEVRAAALVRAVHDPAQLREVMCQFWHDHFSVNSDKDEITAALFPPYDRALRAHALGNFSDLLWASATAPVMLRYLNNDESQASPANENYARELLELHTLGQDHYFNDRYESWRDVPKLPRLSAAQDGLATGYIDDDVYEVARALTGWSVGDGRDYGGGQTKKTGALAYIEAWHDPYQKRILGVEFEANAAPMADGKKLLDMLAVHPATAHFISAKMLRRFGIEAPSAAYHQEIIAVFIAQAEQPDQIARVIRAIISHPEFAATPATKLRRPFEYLAGIYRATGADISPKGDDIDWLLQQAGWRQHRVASPTGHSEHTADWADTRTISGLLNLAIEAHGEWLDTADRSLVRRPDGVVDMAGLADFWAGRFGVEAGVLRPALAGLGMAAEDAPPFDNEGWFEWINTMLVVSAALDPAFLYR